MADLDLRLVRYFTVVARHRNFGRAATELHVAQPSLSRQIQRLEDDLGVRLLDRTPQGSSLTAAGEAFLPQAQALLDAAERAGLTARAAAARHAITIGYVEDLVVTPAVRELRRRYPAARINTRHLTWQDTYALPDGRVDALVARKPLPFSTERFHVSVLYDEPRVAILPISHRLAGKDVINVEDLGEETLETCTVTATIWGGRRPTSADTYWDKLEQIAAGDSVAILPAGDRRSTLRDDVAAVPVEGLDPCQVVVATRARDDNPLVGAFRALATGLLGERASATARDG